MSRLTEALDKARRQGARDAAPAIERERPASTLPSVSGFRFADGDVVTPELDECLSELLREDEPWAEQFRTLATRLRAMDGSDQVRRIGLVSAMGGEGKTTLAVALSLVLAEELADRVLVIDADLRHRSMDGALGLKPSSGLGDWLSKPSPCLEVRQLGRRGPFFLGAGRPFARPWELISSPHLATLLDIAASEFRYVIVDCPAAGPVADAARIQEHLDGLLLVVRERTTPRDAILSALNRLDEDKILGVVLNAEVGAKRRYKHYRYGDYAQREQQSRPSNKRGRK